jgi:hypothetical protein
MDSRMKGWKASKRRLAQQTRNWITYAFMEQILENSDLEVLSTTSLAPGLLKCSAISMSILTPAMEFALSYHLVRWTTDDDDVVTPNFFDEFRHALVTDENGIMHAHLFNVQHQLVAAIEEIVLQCLTEQI